MYVCMYTLEINVNTCFISAFHIQNNKRAQENWKGVAAALTAECSAP
jgi:hypothetical protein